MSLAATILIPTHDHGDTLRLTVASALAQTVSDIELLIIGDGVPEQTKPKIHAIAAGDPRVRFIDHPKHA
jgi:glycosyltransferase involved in cell wall biosynthesis